MLSRMTMKVVTMMMIMMMNMVSMTAVGCPIFG